MVTKTATRPSPRSSHSHSHSQSYRSSKPSTTPVSPLPRPAISVGQPLPPSTLGRSPGIQEAFATTPNYFGLVVDHGADLRDPGGSPRGNRSPPVSSMLSFGAGTPKSMPLDSHVEREALKDQITSNNTFNLNNSNFSYFTSTPGSVVMPPRLDGRSTGSESQGPLPSPRIVSQAHRNSPVIVDRDGERDSAYASSSELRLPSESSTGTPSFSDESPVNVMSPVRRHILSHLDDRHRRLSSPNKADARSPHLSRGLHSRSASLISTCEEGPSMVAITRLKDMIEHLPPSDFLLLDLRVFPQFSQSRIQDALNLCIPTTLLKRPSFNVQKLQDTFTSESEKARFAQWATAKFIVVYDAHSSERKDAISAVNSLKKFTNEGWKGLGYILKGGFAEFSKNYPSLIDNRSSQEMQSSKVNLSLGTSMPRGAAVAGGCMMPTTKSAANPFFGNIRQNQDLIDGVGQMGIKLPPELADDASNILPKWLLRAVAHEDRGKIVSEKFLRLELDEQSRMTKALTIGACSNADAEDPNEVQIAGLEKGSKNRYNNIWPFEHARVRLQGRPEGACDYVNASHIKASRSNKRYIASQGPLPATFEDFWSVIWDQDVRVIVMLTAEHEGGQLKCHPYWESREYGPLKVKILSQKKVPLNVARLRAPGERRDHGRRRAATSAENSPITPVPEQPAATMRTFSLSHSSYPFTPIREITQIHYSSWPDFGAPASPSQLLSLVELSNHMQRASSSPTEPPRPMSPEDDENPRPILVHCSAGCGRTGTFCTIDSVIDMLKRQYKEKKSGVVPMDITPSDHEQEANGQWIFDDDLDLIEQAVEDFRGQRISMVQSLRQYVLCYETIVEWMVQAYAIGKTGRGRSGSESGLVQGNN